jgi:hypothetical protein
MAMPPTLRCRECGRESSDTRWSPFCAPCYESLTHEQRRRQISPPALDASDWGDPESLADVFENALGGELP